MGLYQKLWERLSLKSFLYSQSSVLTVESIASICFFRLSRFILLLQVYNILPHSSTTTQNVFTRMALFGGITKQYIEANTIPELECAFLSKRIKLRDGRNIEKVVFYLNRRTAGKQAKIENPCLLIDSNSRATSQVFSNCLRIQA